MKTNRRKFLTSSLAAAGTLAFSSIFKSSYGRELKQALRVHARFLPSWL